MTFSIFTSYRWCDSKGKWYSGYPASDCNYTDIQGCNSNGQWYNCTPKPKLDGTVEGTSGNDVIDLAYTGDPDGDRIDNNDAILPGAAANDDLIYGYGGNDVIKAGLGKDVVYGGTGNDTIYGEAGNDVIYGDEGRDIVYGGDGDDTVFGGDGNDFVLGGNGNDLVSGGEGNDTLCGQDGDDAICGDAGNDTLEGMNGNDLLFGGLGNDTIYGDAGNDVAYGDGGDDKMYGGTGNDMLFGGAGNDLMEGGDGDDKLEASGGDDKLYGGAGNDDLWAGANNDLVYGGTGDDTIDGGGGNDTLYGGDGNDTISGGNNNDVIYGGEGNDSINGDTSNDTIHGGIGNDDIFGGFGSDRIVGGTSGDVVIGGEDPDGSDVDVLDLTGSDVDRIVYLVRPDGTTDPEAGTVFFNDGTTMTFSEIENVIPCFTPGTLIATPKGERLVEELVEGDRIITRDNGIQDIAWVGHKEMTGKALMAAPHLRPVLIKAGSLGNGLPERDMMVSPNHRMLVASDLTQLYFEEREVLAAAKHLVGGAGVHTVDVMATTYIHFMFERHEVVLANGAWTESFQPGDYSLKGLGNAQRNEIFELFPALKSQVGIESYQSARKALKKHEARLLAR